jgi:hypothetical protein
MGIRWQNDITLRAFDNGEELALLSLGHGKFIEARLQISFT